MRSESRVNGYFIEGGKPLLHRMPARRLANQDWVRIAMVRALRQWLEAHELPAIIIGVLGALLALSTLLVVGGYWLVTP
jgi:uncharacterized iron-regulated membrane protein